MKSLTETAKTHCESRYNEPVLVLEVDWSDTKTGRYAERALSVGGAYYAGIILKVSAVTCSFGEPATEFRPVTVNLFLDDELRSTLADIIPQGRGARLKLAFVGAGPDDMIDLFSGHIEKLTLTGDDTVELTLAGSFQKYDRYLPPDLVSLDEFPKACADSVGRPIPIVFGSVPGLAPLNVRTGGVTRLRGSILSNDTTIEVDDTTSFPASGTLLIEDEQVTYTGVTDNVFTGCVRGANSTVAADHLNRREVIEYMTEHVFLAAGHACKSVDNVRVDGTPVEPGACAIDRNNTTLVPGKTLTTLTFLNRPRVRRYSSASSFLEMQFDATAPGNEAVNPEHCYDTSLEGFATLVARISGAPANDTLKIRQTTDVSGYDAKYGEILKAFVLVEHFESKRFVDDYLSVSVGGRTLRLAKPSEEDTTGGGGEVDLDHGHTHSITGEHTHTMTVKKDSVFANHVIQTGGTTGAWSELEDIAGSNLNQSGFTTSGSTDRNLQCYVSATVAKGDVQRIQFCCRRGESGMTGAFYMRFYRNGSLAKTYFVAGAASPTTFKSGWETISGLTWDDLDNSNTYILITPAGSADPIRLFGVWYELEYLEQPSNYQGSGVKDSGDVTDYSDANKPVINEESISSTSVIEGVDITDLVGKDWSWFNNLEVSVDYNVAGADDGVTGYILHVFIEVEYAPFEELVSDHVTCDLEGIESAGDGSGSLIQNPAEVIRHMLTHLVGLGESCIDSASFEAARISLERAGARFAFALQHQTKASRLLAALSEQAWARLVFESGSFRLVHRADLAGEPVRAIVPGAVVTGSSGVEHAGLDEVFNKIVAYHSRDYSKNGDLADKYTGFAEAEDSQSQSAFGPRERVLELSAVRDHDYAQTLVDDHLARHAAPARRYRWRSLLRDVSLERADRIEITDFEFDLLKARAEMVESSFIPGGEYRRLDTIAFAAELEPYDVYWSAPGDAFIRLCDNAFFFVVNRQLVARLTSDGVFHIKGFVIADQVLPDGAANPLSYSSDRSEVQFCLNDNTTVMALDADGNILLPLQEETDQPLDFAGSADTIASDASMLWFNIGAARAAEVTSDGLLRLPNYIVENCDWEKLYGVS
ncbi:MAG: hypothetical protein Kow0099_04270 [Candidatus Abyssubacteria bacterium]